MSKKIIYFLVIGLLVYLGLSEGDDGSEINFPINGVIVTFEEGVFPGAAESIAESFSLRMKHNYENISRLKGKVIMCLEAKGPDNVYRLIRVLGNHPGVLEVAPDYPVWGTREPDDPFFFQQWGLHNTGQTGGVPDMDVDAPEAWGKFTGSKRVIVAVVDSGIDYNHPDLMSNMWVNPGEILDNGIDDDSNGYVDDIYGIDTLSGSGNPMDDSGHGSHCAGIIGALSDNSQGISGINWHVSLMGVRFLNAFNLGRLSDALECIDYVIAMRSIYGQNIVAINGSYAHNEYVQAEKDAIDAAGELGIVFCAAAGNNNNDNDSKSVYPASYDSPTIVSVTAVDHKGELRYNYGLKSVDLAAPGVNVTSTVSRYSPVLGDVIFDDMESGGDAAWITGGTVPWFITGVEDTTLVKPEHTTPSPDHFWADSPGVFYSNNSYHWLAGAREIDLKQFKGRDIRLGFWAAYFLEPGKDGCALDFSADSGKTWETIFDFGDLPEPAYWEPYNFLIPDSFKTSNFRFRFHLYSNECYEYAGFNFDHIGIGVTADFVFESMSGTSMATPHVTGAVALLAGQYPGDMVEQRIDRILSSVKPLESLAGKCVSGGLLDLDRALGDPTNPVIQVKTPAGGGTFSPGQNITVSWYAWGMDGDVLIILRKDDGSEKFIIDTVPWDSSPYTISLPLEVVSGLYRVRVQKGNVKGDSGVFSVTSVLPVIIVAAPVGGVYHAGGQVEVDWITSGIAGPLSVMLGDGDGEMVFELDPCAPQDVSPRLYNIPCGLSLGEYFIRVCNDFAEGNSPGITIEPTIYCISLAAPRGGESYKQGDLLVIQWNSSGITDTLRVELKRTDGPEDYLIDSNAPVGITPIYYTIPQDLVPGSYFVSIVQGDVTGESLPFTIN